MFSKKNGKVKEIKRFLVTDIERFIYIGKADKFLIRVIDLKKTIDSDYLSNPHVCGRRYKICKNVSLHFPYTSLFIKLIQHKEPLFKEKEIISKYFTKFGEVPPLFK